MIAATGAERRITVSINGKSRPMFSAAASEQRPFLWPGQERADATLSPNPVFSLGLFVTTPNADSLSVINSVAHVETHECWNNTMSPHMRDLITEFVRGILGAEGLDHRGEDIFLWAKA